MTQTPAKVNESTGVDAQFTPYPFRVLNLLRSTVWACLDPLNCLSAILLIPGLCGTQIKNEWM